MICCVCFWIINVCLVYLKNTEIFCGIKLRISKNKRRQTGYRIIILLLLTFIDLSERDHCIQISTGVFPLIPSTSSQYPMQSRVSFQLNFFFFSNKCLTIKLHIHLLNHFWQIFLSLFMHTFRFECEWSSLC